MGRGMGTRRCRGGSSRMATREHRASLAKELILAIPHTTQCTRAGVSRPFSSVTGGTVFPAERMAQRAAEWIRADPSVRAGVVYGSVARKEATEDSDLDLILVAEPGQRERL